MKIFTEQSLWNFQFWSGAADNARSLNSDEMEQVEAILEDLYPDGIDETTLNDMFWFNFPTICEWIGKDLDED